MKLLSGARYRHKDTLDIDLDIEFISYRCEDYVIADVAYINRNWHQGEFLIMREQNVKIPKACIERLERVEL